jgi:excisionase family DNA binding protein
MMKTHEHDEDRLWSVTDVARYLGVSKNTVYYWRSEGLGPRSRRIGKHVRYRREDVIAWVDAQPERVA